MAANQIRVAGRLAGRFAVPRRRNRRRPLADALGCGTVHPACAGGALAGRVELAPRAATIAPSVDVGAGAAAAGAVGAAIEFAGRAEGRHAQDVAVVAGAGIRADAVLVCEAPGDAGAGRVAAQALVGVAADGAAGVGDVAARPADAALAIPAATAVEGTAAVVGHPPALAGPAGRRRAAAPLMASLA